MGRVRDLARGAGSLGRAEALRNNVACHSPRLAPVDVIAARDGASFPRRRRVPGTEFPGAANASRACLCAALATFVSPPAAAASPGAEAATSPHGSIGFASVPVVGATVGGHAVALRIPRSGGHRRHPVALAGVLVPTPGRAKPRRRPCSRRPRGCSRSGCLAWQRQALWPRHPLTDNDGADRVQRRRDRETDRDRVHAREITLDLDLHRVRAAECRRRR